MIEDNSAQILEFDDAEEIVAREDEQIVASSLDFYYGDHWQQGDGWSGPIPAPEESQYDSVREEIERGFVSKNIVREVVDRVVSALLGRDYKYVVKPARIVTEDAPITPEEQALIDEARNLLSKWERKKDLQKNLAKALRHALLSGKSTLRLFIPPGYLQGGEVVIDTVRPIDKLFIDAPTPLSATIYVDDQSREETGVFIADEDTAEITYLLPEVNDRNERIAEITILRDKEEPESVQIDLGGRIPMFQIEMPRVITEQVRSLQKFVNLNLTMMQRNAVLGGFLERIILNGQLPGHYEKDEDGKPYFVRDDYSIGAGAVNAVQGVPQFDEQGNVSSYTTASVQHRDPISVKTFIEAVEMAYKGILESCEQLHALISGDSASTGEARRQALSGFHTSLKTPKQQIDMAGEWTIETVLAYAGYLSGDTGKFSSLEVSFETHIDTGSIPAAELDLIERQVRVGIISLETARERIGIEDPVEEASRVEKEAETKRTLQQAEVKNPMLQELLDNQAKADAAETGGQS